MRRMGEQPEQLPNQTINYISSQLSKQTIIYISSQLFRCPLSNQTIIYISTSQEHIHKYSIAMDVLVSNQLTLFKSPPKKDIRYNLLYAEKIEVQFASKILTPHSQDELKYTHSHKKVHSCSGLERGVFSSWGPSRRGESKSISTTTTELFPKSSTQTQQQTTPKNNNNKTTFPHRQQVSDIQFLPSTIKFDQESAFPKENLGDAPVRFHLNQKLFESLLKQTSGSCSGAICFLRS